MALFAGLALIASACGSGVSEDDFRAELVDEGLSEDQANCIIDGLSDAGIPLADITDDALGDDDPPAEVMDITMDCVFAGMDSDSGGDTLMSDANAYGDDPALDALWDQCDAGDGAACDELYFSSPFGSEYEDFGDRCGGRFEEAPISCEEEMG